MSDNHTLITDDAIALWKSGKSKWNDWVEKHPKWNIDFSGADFGNECADGEIVSFESFKFPSGRICFDNVRFGDRDVDFSLLNIDVISFSFVGAKIEGGQFSCVDSTITAKFISFDSARFGNGLCSFFASKLRSENIIFDRVSFLDADVSFLSAEFGDKNSDEGVVSFKHVDFGCGVVNFSGAVFVSNEWASERKILNFSGSSFRGKYFKCESTQFPKSTIFASTRFECTSIILDKSTFGHGYLNFNRMLFTGDYFRMSDVEIHCPRFDFSEVNITKACVHILRCKFDTGWKNFSYSNFGRGQLILDRTDFGSGDVIFDKAVIGSSLFSVKETKFDKGSVTFEGAYFASNEITFKGSVFNGNLYFSPRYIKGVDNIVFYNVEVGGELAFGNFETSSVIDLRHSKLSRTVDIDSVTINYQKVMAFPNLRWLTFRKSLKTETSTCYRRLKKLAKESDDHDSALEFFANEKRSDYWRNIRGWWLAFYLFYDFFSEYGKSIARPSVSLVVLWVLFSVVYFSFGEGHTLDNFGSALLFSLSHTLPIYLGARSAKDASVEALFGADPPMWIHGVGVFQEIFCGVFLFLILLALRNRARS